MAGNWLKFRKLFQAVNFALGFDTPFKKGTIILQAYDTRRAIRCKELKFIVLNIILLKIEKYL